MYIKKLNSCVDNFSQRRDQKKFELALPPLKAPAKKLISRAIRFPLLAYEPTKF
jgi:hypothetical protein